MRVPKIVLWTTGFLVATVVTIVAGYFIGNEVDRYRSQRRTAELREKAGSHEVQILARMKTIEIGAPLSDFDVTLIDGTRTTLLALVDQSKLITYFEYGCDACVAELSELGQALQDGLPKESVILISYDDPSTLERLRKEFGLDCPIVWDSGSILNEALNIYSYPFNIVVNDSGRIEEVIINQLHKEDFEDMANKFDF
ncbi:MAG: redoxin domain-containing protein [candidate division Zixibacteria bacterium]|nr:redoxin domain-containing protein [candidate division Zixibacteria bacterium]